MVKSVIIFQNIENNHSFEEYIRVQIIPELLKADNVDRIQVTTFQPSGLNTPENLASIHVILDVYWETIDAMQSYIETPVGAQAINLVMNNPHGAPGAFMCKERSFTDQSV